MRPPARLPDDVLVVLVHDDGSRACTHKFRAWLKDGVRRYKLRIVAPAPNELPPGATVVVLPEEDDDE